jgi:hypothetical protein
MLLRSADPAMSVTANGLRQKPLRHIDTRILGGFRSTISTIVLDECEPVYLAKYQLYQCFGIISGQHM